MVQQHDLSQLINDHPFFRGFDDPYLTLIAGCAKNEVFHVGDYMFKDGDDAERFYLIRSGSVALEIHMPGREPVIVETLGEGDILGWSWITDRQRTSNDARALSLCRMITFDASCLIKKMEEDHSLGYALYQRFVPVIIDRLAHTRIRLTDMYGAD